MPAAPLVVSAVPRVGKSTLMHTNTSSTSADSARHRPDLRFPQPVRRPGQSLLLDHRGRIRVRARFTL